MSNRRNTHAQGHRGLTALGLGLSLAVAPQPAGAAAPPGHHAGGGAGCGPRPRAAQPARGQAARAAGAGADPGRQRRGDAHPRSTADGRPGRRAAAAAERQPAGRRRQAGQGPVRRAGPRADRPGLRAAGRVRRRAPPDYPDQDTDPDTPGPARFDGPLHNEIPEPDRGVDNSTVWQPDFSQQYFQDLYFGTGGGVESMKTYYERQSSGRYSIDGEVTDWVKVPYNEARYGRSDGYPCDPTCCDNTWDLVKDGMNQWVADQEAAGRSARDRRRAGDLRRVGPLRLRRRRRLQRARRLHRPHPDRARGRRPGRRRPLPGRGRHLEPPLVRVRHRRRLTGPDDNPLGGTEIGDTGIWAGDYTIQPENGGLSTIAHEYGHDLGLPDHYDTAGAARTASSGGR